MISSSQYIPQKMKEKVMNITSVFTASLLFASATLTPAQSQTPTARQSLANGKRLYEVNCANCHGPRAQGAVKAGFEISIITERGGKQPPDLTDRASDHGSTDAQIFNVVKKGVPSTMMPAYQGRLSDVQIRNVVAYVRSLASPQRAASTGADRTAKLPARQNNQRTLALADYVELPITGDMSTDRVTGVLARGSILRDEPGGNRFFVNDLNGPLYMLDKQTKRLTTYLNFDGGGRPPWVVSEVFSQVGVRVRAHELRI